MPQILSLNLQQKSPHYGVLLVTNNSSCNVEHVAIVPGCERVKPAFGITSILTLSQPEETGRFGEIYLYCEREARCNNGQHRFMRGFTMPSSSAPAAFGMLTTKASTSVIGLH